MGEVSTRYHVALDVATSPACWPRVAQAFAEQGVSIQTVRQEGRGDAATLVLVTHAATDAALDAHRRTKLAQMAFVRRAASVMRVEGDDAVTDVQVPMRTRVRGRGLIEAYRDRLPVTDAHPGGHPVRGRHAAGAGAGRCPSAPAATVYLKVEGANPTGSFKDRGMTMAISKAAEDGAQAVICASTGNTSASAAAYAVRAGMTCAVLVPQGKIALGKMAQALVHGAQLLQVDGNFDDCLELARSSPSTTRSRWSTRSTRTGSQGQKTAAFEICDVLGRAPDVHCIPVGNAGNITAYWKGYREYAADGVVDTHAADVRLPGRRRRADRHGRAGAATDHDRDRHPHRQPGVVDLGRAGPRRVAAG